MRVITCSPYQKHARAREIASYFPKRLVQYYITSPRICYLKEYKDKWIKTRRGAYLKCYK